MSEPAEVIAALRRVLASQASLRWGYLFGSAVHSAGHRDVDVAVMPAEGAFAGGVAWGQLVGLLEQAVGSKVDLVDLQHAELPLVGPLLTACVVVLDREPVARHRWEAETTSRWLDFRPAFEEANRVRQRAMARRLSGGS